MKDMNIFWYSWQDMCLDVIQLCSDIVLDNFKPDVIVGLSRGGLTPGVMMSHWLKKPFKPVKSALRDFPEWEDYLPRKTDKRVLILDDICDSGETFERISKHIKGPRENMPLQLQCDVRFASLWWNNEVDFKPHYYVREEAKDTNKLWIIFPW